MSDLCHCGVICAVRNEGLSLSLLVFRSLYNMAMKTALWHTHKITSDWELVCWDSARSKFFIAELETKNFHYKQKTMDTAVSGLHKYAEMSFPPLWSQRLILTGKIWNFVVISIKFSIVFNGLKKWLRCRHYEVSTGNMNFLPVPSPPVPS